MLAGCDPSSGVPSCPQWTAVDLLSHVVTVQRFWAAVIGDRLSAAAVADFERSRSPLPEDPATLLELRGQATTDLLTALHSREASEPAWSWFTADQTVGFTWRMQTHEATMHRVDAELAAGLPISPTTSEVAADGVDHVVEVMWAWAPRGAERHVTGTIELLATDSGRRWLVRTFRWSGQVWGQQFTKVQINLLLLAADWPLRRDVVRGVLNADDSFTIDHDAVPVAVALHCAAEQPGPELALAVDVLGVEHDDAPDDPHD